MKKLDNLVRLHRWRLDEKRRKLENGLKIEQQGASRDTEAATGYGSYASAVIARRQKLNQSLAGLESELAEATDDVAEAFQEFKKFDLIKTRNEHKAKLSRKRVHQKEIDEAGLNVYRRASTS